MLTLNTLSFSPEEVQVGSSGAVKMNLDLNKLLLLLLDPFFSVGTKIEGAGIDETAFNSLSNDEKLTKVFTLVGVPQKNEPGITTVIAKVIELVLQAVGTYVEEFILLKEQVTRLLSALTDPAKYTDDIKDIISKLKKLIETVKKFFTDTKGWIEETLMMPFQEIKIPVPPFEIDLGKIIPALPVKFKVPQINKAFPFGPTKDPSKSDEENATAAAEASDLPDLSGVKGVNVMSLKKMSDLEIDLKGLLDLVNQGVDLGALSRGEASQDQVDKAAAVGLTPEGAKSLGIELPAGLKLPEFGAGLEGTLSFVSQIKDMIISLVTSPVKLLIGFINTLLDTITGMISFDFSGFKDLLAMMPPSVESMQGLFLKIIDSFAPNFSTVFLQTTEWLKSQGLSLNFLSPDYLEVVSMATLHIRSMDAEASTKPTSEGGDATTMIDGIETKVNEILGWEGKLKEPTTGLGSEFFSTIPQLGTELRTQLSEYNKKCNDLSVPNTYVTSTPIQATSELVAVVNTATGDGTKDLLLGFYDDVASGVANVNSYTTNSPELLDQAYSVLSGAQGSYVNRSEVDALISIAAGVLTLDIESIDKLPDLSRSDLVGRVDSSLSYLMSKFSEGDSFMLSEYFLALTTVASNLTTITEEDRGRLRTFASNYHEKNTTARQGQGQDDGSKVNFEKSAAAEKKNSETPPNLEQIADHFKTFTDLMSAGPNAIVSLLKAMFDYALEGLPPIPGVTG